MNKKPAYISNRFNFETAVGSSIIDELPLWSAPFGIELLNQIEFKSNLKVLDIGFGTGFPLIEIGQRLGASSTVYGIDPWGPSHTRTMQKIKFYGLKNIKLIKGIAENIPLKNKSIDLIVSNNGVNNVSDMNKVFSECSRISKTGAQFLISVNLNRTMFEFYDIMKEVLNGYRLIEELKNVDMHIYEKRKPVSEIKSLFINNGFEIVKITRKSFKMKFKDGDTFFNHSLIKIGFLSGWEKLLDNKHREKVFKEIRKRMNRTAKKSGYIEMTIPYIVISARKR